MRRSLPASAVRARAGLARRETEVAFGRLHTRAGAQPMSDINMTPLIDVMLVLLVIFIISAPLMASSLRLDLPKAAGGTPSDAVASLSLAVDAQGRTFLGDAPVTSAQLAERVRAAARANPATEVQLRADSQVPYGRVAELIGLVQEAGLSRIGFVTLSPEPGATGAPGAAATPGRPPGSPAPAGPPARK